MGNNINKNYVKILSCKIDLFLKKYLRIIKSVVRIITKLLQTCFGDSTEFSAHSFLTASYLEKPIFIAATV